VKFSSQSYRTSDPGEQIYLPHAVSARFVDRLLPQLQAGRLHLLLPDGRAIARRGAQPGPEATVTIRRWRGLRRILLDGEDGFSAGYIDGDWTTPDLAQVLELGMRNETALMPDTNRWLLSLLRNRVLHALRANTKRGSRRNITAHYDLGNDFFRPWLDAGMNYSSALYAGDEMLERAQQRKLDRIAELLALSGGERVLEIGCGWGGLAERLIRGFGATVCGITLSREQLSYAKERLSAEIESGTADFRLVDYRGVHDRYDRIASVEMIEAVGERYWPTYFGKIRDCLASGGIALIQAITINESRFAEYRRRPDFIQRHIFPGGMLPTPAIIEREAARANLKLVQRQSFGESYAQTLREWRIRFIRAAPKLDTKRFGERFQRMWEYYLIYCEIGFRCGAIDVGFYKLLG
jgi:cyclopropane-fatty-acyl-phospholipid synthase